MRSLSSKSANLRKVKSCIYVVAEGCTTEKEYFSQTVFRELSGYCVKSSCPKKGCGGNDPKSLLKRAKEVQRNLDIAQGDQIWIVLDRDTWSEADINSLIAWAREKDYRHIAISNPKIELWLIHHFTAKNPPTTSLAVSKNLKRHWKDYAKGIRIDKFSHEDVFNATARSRKWYENRSQSAGIVLSEATIPAAGSSSLFRLTEQLGFTKKSESTVYGC